MSSDKTCCCSAIASGRIEISGKSGNIVMSSSGASIITGVIVVPVTCSNCFCMLDVPVASDHASGYAC